MAARIFAGVLCAICNVPVMVWFHQWALHTRRKVAVEACNNSHEERNIPWDSTEGYDDNNCDEDVMISTCCLPCSIAQMMQQTTNYDAYRAIWWSETGLPYEALERSNDVP